jgi:quercetin dioxygenase-like cupin family protein
VSITFIKRDELPASSFSHELVGDDFGGVPACVIFVDAEPGRRVRLHQHPYAELFILLEGEATFEDGAAKRVARPGEVVIVPPGQAHGFANTGTGNLRQIDVHLSPRFVTDWLEPSS